MINSKLCCLLVLSAYVGVIHGDAVQEEADAYMQEMKESENKDPKTPTVLAYETLKKAFEKANPSGLSMMQVLEKLENFKGPAKYYALRMFEKMDENFDGQITSSEMGFVYEVPVSSEPASMKLMFQVKDLNQDGFITPWEVVRENMILDGNVLPVSTMWKNAMDVIKTDDLDNNGVVDLEEYTLGMVMKANMGIVQAKKKAAGLDSRGMKQRKFDGPKPTLRRAYGSTIFMSHMVHHG